MDDMTPEEAQMLADALRQFAQSLRQQMERLMNGEPLTKSELEALGEMVGLNETDDLRYQNWMAQRMQRALEFPEVREAMRELMEQLQQMGMSKERMEQLRDQIRQNLQGMQQQINQFAGERINSELRYHGRYGVEYRLFRDNQFYEGQGFRTRTPAVQAAASVRRQLEDDGWSS